MNTGAQLLTFSGFASSKQNDVRREDRALGTSADTNRSTWLAAWAGLSNSASVMAPKKLQMMEEMITLLGTMDKKKNRGQLSTQTTHQANRWGWWTWITQVEGWWCPQSISFSPNFHSTITVLHCISVLDLCGFTCFDQNNCYPWAHFVTGTPT